jgi:hypothetical protein
MNLQENISRIQSMMGIINEGTSKNPINELNELQKGIENLLTNYEVKDGKVYDIKANQPVDFSGLGSHFKTKIESIFVGAQELGQGLNVQSKKDEVTNSEMFKKFFGDYNNIPIAKNIIVDDFTDIRCEYFRKGVSKEGKKLDITKRPWCEKN